MKIIYNLLNPFTKNFISIENELITKKTCNYLYSIIFDDMQQIFGRSMISNSNSNDIYDEYIYYLSTKNKLIPNSNSIFISNFINSNDEQIEIIFIHVYLVVKVV